MSDANFKNAALVLVDIQNDFCPGGALAVRDGDKIVSVVNRLIPHFPVVVAARDWHPADHCSFKAQGGPWPPHCVLGSRGAELHPDLDATRITSNIRKAFTRDADSYSEFSGVDEMGRSLHALLRDVKQLYIVGLATDYCVRATALDALKLGYEVFVVTDAVRAVNVRPGDGEQALAEMERAGASLVKSKEVLALR
ncbi:MAG TPA: bifunctional nicotinamidase/pyrazinamidase [Verrucomicrobiae bacterium]|nr:bifunctional nicotinamidase/pyrazinamidase [Verrucomicrobiae bacterium]